MTLNISERAAIILFNAFIGAFVWTAIGNMIAPSFSDTFRFVWWHGMLFSFIPVIGEWYVAVTVLIILLAIVGYYT